MSGCTRFLAGTARRLVLIGPVRGSRRIARLHPHPAVCMGAATALLGTNAAAFILLTLAVSMSLRSAQGSSDEEGEDTNFFIELNMQTKGSSSLVLFAWSILGVIRFGAELILKMRGGFRDMATNMTRAMCATAVYFGILVCLQGTFWVSIAYLSYRGRLEDEFYRHVFNARECSTTIFLHTIVPIAFEWFIYALYFYVSDDFIVIDYAYSFAYLTLCACSAIMHGIEISRQSSTSEEED